jgi:hypothetical protein
MIEVGTFETRTDAASARALLAHAGIPSVLVPDEESGHYFIGLNGGARLFVADADTETAAAILRHRVTRDEADP